MFNSDYMNLLYGQYKNPYSSARYPVKTLIRLHRYPVKTLIRLHEPYAKVTKWQINQTRTHARLHGPGTIQDTKKSHRVRVDAAKLDHFIDFINRSHFYQDVAYGVRELKLESGKRIEMPNIVRIITRSTMVALYMK